MSLIGIVRALGGDLYQNGHRANVPAPGHGAGDRSVSLVLSNGRVVVHSFGGATWSEVLDDLRQRGLIDRSGCPNGVGTVPASAPRPDRSARIATARALWSAGAATQEGGLVAHHLTRRGLVWSASFQDLREHPEAPLWVYGNGGRMRRAMMARVSDTDGVTTAVELTYLDPSGRQSADLRVPRKTVGQVPGGSAVRLSPIASAMVVSEGVVTTLSAMAQFGRPGWALLSAGNLARWRAPANVRDILIAADRGAAGEEAATRLKDRLCADGVASRIVWPPLPWGDWNEALVGNEA